MKRNSRHVTAPFLFASIFAIAPTCAVAKDDALRDENLLQTWPTDFKIGDQQEKDHVSMSEMVPRNESVENWTQMVTTQVFHGIANPDFYDAYKASSESTFKKACDSTESIPFPHLDGMENGYPVHLWMQFCRYKDAQKPPEVTLFKYIQGRDATYVVQWASHSEPTKQEFQQRMRYLASVRVCDTRREESPCSMPSRDSKTSE